MLTFQPELPAHFSTEADTPSFAVPGVVSAVGYRSVEGVYRGLPSSRLTLIVSLDDGLQVNDMPSEPRPIPVVLAGLQLQASRVRKGRGQGVVQLAVHPLAARALFGVPAAELNAASLDAAAVLGRPVSRLHEQVTEAKNWPLAFARVARYLQGARRAAPVRPEVAYAWKLLAHSHGQIPVRVVAGQVGISPRHLTTLFHREVGHTPKTVAMLMRFEFGMSFPEIAAELGQSADGVRMKLNRALKQMALLLDGDE